MDTNRRRLMYTFLVVGIVILLFMFVKRKKVKVKRQIAVKQIDDWGVRTLIDKALYEFSSPEKGTQPTVQVVFFHGLEFRDSNDAFLNTWISSRDSSLWPKEWLSKEFKHARILSVSYDSNVIRSPTTGNLELYNIAENSVQNLVDGEHSVTSHRNCPILMVGKDVGCLVIKEICIQAKRRKERTLLENIKGFLFYSPIVMGLKNCPINMDGELAKCLQWNNADITRLNADFLRLKGKHKWVQKVMMAINDVEEKSELLKYIPEVSSRPGADVFYSASEDRHSICRPDDRTFKSFTYLKDLIYECVALKGRGQKVHGLPENPVGLEECAREVEQKLTGAFVLGIVGMGGSGKTTLAKQLFNNISSEFDYTCFIADVKQSTSISNIDNYVRSAFYEKGKRILPIEWNELEKKKILIAMDDVDCDEHVNFLPTLSSIGEGSKIVLTTRNKELVKFWNQSSYHDMNLLDPEKAERLFCAHAFNLDRIPESLSMHMTDYAKKVITKCSGLPLTLEVMGRYLRYHDQEDELQLWKDTFDALCNTDVTSDINEKVWGKLRVSYDALKEKEKEMFIDAATFFLGEPLETALSAWKTVYERPSVIWNTLVSRSLVKCHHEVSREPAFQAKVEFKSIWVHEHLQDLGKKILEANSKETSRPRQLRLVNCSWSLIAEQRSDVSGKDFTNLKYLELYEVPIEGTYEMFPKNLHFLRWSASKATSFPVDLAEMNNLAVLELVGFKHVQPLKFPPALRILKLHYIKGFKGFLKEFGTLSSDLEVVEIKTCPDLETLPDSFGNLTSLQRLQLGSMELFRDDDSTMLCTLPNTFGQLKALRMLVINAPDLGSLPDSFEALKSLQKLALRSFKIRGLPKGFGELSSLKELNMNVPHLLSLPGSISMLPALSRLEINSKKLKSLPKTFGGLSSLNYLYLDTSNLISLPDSFSGLSALRTFTIDSAMESLPKTFGGLSSLNCLYLDTSNLISLPDSFSGLSALRTLEINSAKLESLPETFGGLSSLNYLYLDTSNLISLPDSFSGLSALRTLKIDSEELESLPETFGGLSSLNDLTLGTSNLISLPDSFSGLSALRTLRIASAKLESLPKTFGELSSLHDLTLKTSNLISLPDSFSGLSALRTLRITSAKLESLPKTFGELSSLHDLTLKTSNLISLPDSFSGLSALRTLRITSAKLESLPKTFGELSSLHDLTLMTSNLISLPDSFSGLSALKTLYIVSAKLKSLPYAFGDLSSLQELFVSRCPNLEYLSEGVGGLSSLRKLKLRSCPKLLQLPKSLGYRYGDRRAEVEGDISAGSAGGLVVEVEDCFFLADNMLRGLQSVKISTFPFHFWDVNPLPRYEVVMEYPDRASKERKRAVVSVNYIGVNCRLEIVEDPALEERPGDPSSSDAGLHISHTGGAVPSAIESSRDKMARLFREADVHPTQVTKLFRLWALQDVQNKKFESALKVIGAAHELDKDDGWLWQERGVLRRLMGDPSGALEDLNNALEIEPDDYEHLKHRAYVKHLLGDDTGASADAERAIQVRPARVDRESYGKYCLGELPVQFLHYRLK